MRPGDGPISPPAITRGAEASPSAAIVGAAPEAGTPRGGLLPRMRRRKSRVARTDSHETRRDRRRPRTRHHFAERCRQRDRREPHHDVGEPHRKRPCHVAIRPKPHRSGRGGNRAGQVAIASGESVFARASVAVAFANDPIATDSGADGLGHVTVTGDSFAFVAHSWHAPRLSPHRTRLRPGAAWSRRHLLDQCRCGARPPSGRGSERAV